MLVTTGQHHSILPCKYDDLLKFKASIRAGKKYDLSDFERGKVVSAISFQLLICCAAKTRMRINFFLLMSVVRGQNGLVDAHRNESTQVITDYNQGLHCSTGYSAAILLDIARCM